MCLGGFLWPLLVAGPSHGDSFRKIMVEKGVHLLDYPRAIYTDVCGSMVYVRGMTISMGINHIAIPPHSQSLNEAERMADRLWACGPVLGSNRSAQRPWAVILPTEWTSHATGSSGWRQRRTAIGLHPMGSSGVSSPVSPAFMISRFGLSSPALHLAGFHRCLLQEHLEHYESAQVEHAQGGGRRRQCCSKWRCQ